ncbi:predicted protein [Arabidopsis lyrata subsp. lyrata]|uniref:Predicted protein n=1 Tax=Arabidopsis lyrata subsp. lyrata TaxID=81972 RepID=D7LGS5_ARALL|nr:predicted protein [Arabidopsis lyrata subsp. lyrata]
MFVSSPQLPVAAADASIHVRFVVAGICGITLRRTQLPAVKNFGRYLNSASNDYTVAICGCGDETNNNLR